MNIIKKTNKNPHDDRDFIKSNKNIPNEHLT